MSDVAAADTPVTESARLGPDGPEQTAEQMAVSSIAEFLDPAQAETPEPDVQPEEQVAEGEDTPEEAPEPEQAVEEAEAEEAEVESVEELPNTLSEFAEAVGITAEELAGHLLIPSKDADGNDVEVTLAEAIRGNLRQADYTAKTMELAEARKEFESGKEAARQEWLQRFEQVDNLLTSLQSQIETVSPEYMNQLLEDDPQEYLRLRAQQDAREGALRDAAIQRQQAMEAQKQEFTAKQAEIRQREQRALAEHIPELKDVEARTKFETELTTYLGSLGYGAEEVADYMGGVFDHRVIRMARDAMKFADLEKGKKEVAKKLKGLPKVKKPGQAKDIKQSKLDAEAAKRNRMVRTGSDADAVEFIKGLL